MAIEQEDKKSIFFRIDKNFAYNFDVLQNIKVSSRKSSNGFSDDNKLMLSMRDGTTKLGENTLTGGDGTSELFFFSDFFGKKHKVRGYNNRVYWLNDSNNWEDISGDMSGNNFEFNTVKLPIMINGSSPTEYTTGGTATESEAVVKDGSDTGGASNIGKILIITDNSGDNQVYKGCFGIISAYDTDSNSYILGDSGILGTSTDDFETVTGLASGSKYQIYDTLGECLQVYNGVDNDRYFYGGTDGELHLISKFTGFTTDSLRNIQALTSSQYLSKQVRYSNYYFTFNKGTLYYSGGNLENPFFYTITKSLTIPGIKGGNILDIFVFKKRLIIAGDNFIAYINSLSDLIQVEIITNTYGMKANSLKDVGVDAYFISSDKYIYSLSETLAGTLIATNVGKQVNNYIKNFNTKICSGFDGNKLYYYGQYDNNTDGVIVVLDIQYKFWSIYTGLKPSSIVTNDGITYLTDNNSDIVRYFDSTTILDIGNTIEQKVAFNEIYLDDVFSSKIISDIYLWLDNYDQKLYIDCYLANPIGNYRKQRKSIEIESVNIPSEDNSLGEDLLGENILGGEGYESEISFPFLKHIVFDSDSANIWKIVLTGKEGSPFYLNEFMIEIGYEEGTSRTYFSPINTI